MDDKREAEEFNNFIKAWAQKKMRLQEKKLKYYARLYYGKSVAIMYVKEGVSAKIVREGDTEEEVES